MHPKDERSACWISYTSNGFTEWLVLCLLTRTLDSNLVYRLFLLRVLCGFPESLWENAEIVLEIRLWKFASPPFKFIIRKLPYHSVLHNMNGWSLSQPLISFICPEVLMLNQAISNNLFHCYFVYCFVKLCKLIYKGFQFKNFWTGIWIL
jgi:hypothetical protein